MSPAPAIAPLPLQARPEQRHNRRYPIGLEIEYSLVSRGEIQHRGVGRTLNIGSGGLLFETPEPLPEQGLIRIAIRWPFLHESGCALKLVIHGRVVRSDSAGVAVTIHRHEFRTAGTIFANGRPGK